MRLIVVLALGLLAACGLSSSTDEPVVVANVATPSHLQKPPFRAGSLPRTQRPTRSTSTGTAPYYCGCAYTSDDDSDGSGRINADFDCGYQGPDSYASRAGRIEWEHIVPASLMPAARSTCWAYGGRDGCIRSDPQARAMLLDLHNLAPSIGQVNALRLNGRYADLPDGTSDFGACRIEDAKDRFEPPDCAKGDAARTWLYMEAAHGVEIPADKRAMFLGWSAADPVSPWEGERERRVAAIEGVHNPFVAGLTPDAAGACPWEEG